jgi:hypothetical protein
VYLASVKIFKPQGSRLSHLGVSRFECIGLAESVFNQILSKQVLCQYAKLKPKNL